MLKRDQLRQAFTQASVALKVRNYNKAMMQKMQPRRVQEIKRFRRAFVKAAIGLTFLAGGVGITGISFWSGARDDRAIQEALAAQKLDLLSVESNQFPLSLSKGFDSKVGFTAKDAAGEVYYGVLRRDGIFVKPDIAIN